MWDYYGDYNFEETEVYKISTVVVNYLKSVSEIKSKEYTKNMSDLRSLFDSKDISEFLDEVDNLSFSNRIELKKIININLNFEDACYEKNCLYEYFQVDKSLEKKIYKIFAEKAMKFNEKIWKRMEKERYVEIILDSRRPNVYCPICGLEILKNKKNGKRSPLDHFFPKKKYAFLYFYELNLILMCESCNSKKGQKTITDYGWMYPYKNRNNISFDLELLSIDIFNHQYEFSIKNINEGNLDREYIEKYKKCWNEIFDLKNRILESYKNIIEVLENEYLEILLEEDKDTIKRNYNRLKKQEEKKGNIIEKSYYEYKLKEM